MTTRVTVSEQTVDVSMRLPVRFIQPADRPIFVAIGSWAVVTGLLLVADPTAWDRLWLAPVWPIMQAVGGVLSLIFARSMTSLALRGWASSLLVMSSVGRGASLTLSMLNGRGHSWESTLAGVALWTFIGWLLYVTWRVRVPDPGGTRDVAAH